MIGGTIVQIVGDRIEVLESQSCDRTWRRLEDPGEVHAGDEIWWESKTAFLSRRGVFRDKNIGQCTPSDPPTRAEMEAA